MTNLQLVLTAGVPFLAILVGIFMNNARFNKTAAGFDQIEKKLTDLDNLRTTLRKGRLDA